MTLIGEIHFPVVSYKAAVSHKMEKQQVELRDREMRRSRVMGVWGGVWKCWGGGEDVRERKVMEECGEGK